MNSPSASRVRFVCRLVRLRAAFAAPSNEGHVATCPACQCYFAANAELEQRLTMQARKPAPAVPAGLDERIFQAIQPTLRQRRRRRMPTGWIAMGLAGAAAAIALLLVVQSRPSAPPSIAFVEELVVPVEVETSGAPQVVQIDQWSDRLWSALATDASAASPENPLQREITAVRADTRAALRFLAANFLPANQTVPSADETAPASS